ncbi:MAG: pyridoxamine 5'-phosphate oxidase family protein [Saprospiraceae bacterium]|nr:pyridoxamine 5'-phosphate oxidase family protein [Saprospiraceae bacterium]
MMVINDSSLPQLLLSALHALSEAAQNPQHPFRSFAVATVWEGQPFTRTVILRDFTAEPTQLFFFTHALSPKVSHIRHQPEMACLFYDSQSGCQLRLKGQAHVHQDDQLAQKYWSAVPPSRYGDYTHPTPPGHPILPPSPTPTLNFFSVIRTEIYEVDILLIRKQGHKRATFHKSAATFNGLWVQP